jgi:hypothetical protein
MKYRNKIALGICSMTALVLMSGCVVRPYGGVVVETPAPPPVAVVEVPDDYVWDGYEYVGLVGGVYFYLGPGNVWFRCEPWRLQRFHGWERYHPDWHNHAIHNDRYRRDAQGHEHPWHGGHGHDHDDEH